MANANVDLPFGVTKHIKIQGRNAANTADRPCTGYGLTNVISYGGNTITAVPTGDGQIFSFTNTAQSASYAGSIVWKATNELGQVIVGTTPVTQIPADPATQLVSQEVV